MAESKDIYAILGVARDASSDEIRRAYRKLARTHHPDVNPGDPAAEERFKEVAAAYEVLSDPDKRKLYDEFGEEGLAGGFDPDKARAYRRWSDARQRGGPGPGDMPFEFDLSDLFGGASPGASRSATRGGRDIAVTVDLDFVQALRGAQFEVRVPYRRDCDTCHGSGDAPGTTAQVCTSCGGSGRAQAVQGPMRILRVCPACGGAGEHRTPCPTCHGRGATTADKPVTVRIPAGAEDGSQLRVRGRGEPGVAGGPAGDLLVTTRVRPHPHFRRKGLDLTLHLPVTLDEAYNGAEIDVPTPDGIVQMKVPPRSQAGARLRLRGKGVARGDRHGDLYVVLEVRLPPVADEALAKALRDAAALYDAPVREGISL